ncbi:hypothetical protein Tco_1015570 [Tanacetum coccineum]|uniref:Uncharacterized protein n=1 Tax=Tanacetum coccineum TaxID=301880 RepID=A0ABQ5FLA0_9ASTR
MEFRDSENWSIRHIGTQYGISGLLGVGSKNKIFQNFLELVWIWRIGPPGYGVSDLLDTAYRTYWVWRIELLRYGVLGSLATAYWATPDVGEQYHLDCFLELQMMIVLDELFLDFSSATFKHHFLLCAASNLGVLALVRGESLKIYNGFGCLLQLAINPGVANVWHLLTRVGSSNSIFIERGIKLSMRSLIDLS